MPEYKHEVVTDDTPCWQIVIYHDPDEPQYDNFYDGTERLDDEGLINLTQSEAEQKADELNRQYYQG